MELISVLLLTCTFLIIFVFFMTNLNWIIKELRSICKDESGYIKLVQLVFVILVLFSFFILLVYNLIFRETTSKLDIFLTVIVGLMGTVIGVFFSERTMESIKLDRDRKRKAVIKKTIKLKEYDKVLERISKKLN